MIKAVIFDMDGLLIDSEPLWQEAVIEILKKVGVPLTREMARETMGLRIDEAVGYWFNRYPWENIPKEEIEKQVIAKVIELINERGKSLPGSKEIIETLYGKNIPMAVASSSLMEVIDVAVEKLDIRRYLKIIHSAEYEKFGKPHPDIYLSTAKKLGIAPENCLSFEDSFAGVSAAKAAGMKCIVVPNELAGDDERFKVADMILKSLKDFRLDFLKEF